MLRTLLFCALTVLPLAAFASSSAGTSAGASSAGSSASSSGHDKVVAAARDDAAGFVASAGAIRGARLEAAFVQLRSRSEAARLASDLELAQAILAQ
ncbi:DUF2388 domain-containing protein [Xanthomonas maliensis]|uniref:DUF2388 domain-containing protein n=1 Tax=Xanthomonas maliensis TaxID=1321368 RepID=UPI00039A7754|nr:DUF2388 domain-containing protein [Xanthomonas maliensis]KAB7768168.1 hypothetical protein CKY51_09880 [Xanthomonas maliensis]